MKAVVVYESHWGNTEAIAQAVAAGFGPGAEALTTDEASGALLVDVDLVVACAPLVAFSLLGPIAPDENGEDRMLVADAQAGSADDHKPVALRIEAREDLVIARAVTTMVAPA